MLDTIITGVIAICINMSIGATVFTLMDNEEGTLQVWFDGCPTWCAWFMKPLILNSWFFWLVPFLKSVWS
jgi:hypothetical protein